MNLLHTNWHFKKSLVSYPGQACQISSDTTNTTKVSLNPPPPHVLNISRIPRWWSAGVSCPSVAGCSPLWHHHDSFSRSLIISFGLMYNTSVSQTEPDVPHDIFIPEDWLHRLKRRVLCLSAFSDLWLSFVFQIHFRGACPLIKSKYVTLTKWRTDGKALIFNAVWHRRRQVCNKMLHRVTNPSKLSLALPSAWNYCKVNGEFTVNFLSQVCPKSFSHQSIKDVSLVPTSWSANPTLIKRMAKSNTYLNVNSNLWSVWKNVNNKWKWSSVFIFVSVMITLIPPKGPTRSFSPMELKVSSSIISVTTWYFSCMTECRHSLTQMKYHWLLAL